MSDVWSGYVVFMAVVILLALFLFQSCGTSKVGFSFSPIMFLWFAANVFIGIYNIVAYNPAVLRGLSPHYIFKFFGKQGKSGWEVLGAVFLCTTGGEAMFADLGHFNKRAIQVFAITKFKCSLLCIEQPITNVCKFS